MKTASYTANQPAIADQTLRRLLGRLKIRHLSLLLQIRQHGSLTRVAEQMATSQPAITQSLAELEDMFGARLFHRTAKGMLATPIGEIVLARARTILNDLDLLTRDLHASTSGRRGHLHIGAMLSISEMQLAKAIQRTRERQPDMTISIQNGSATALLDLLREHALDLVVARLTDSIDMAGLHHEVLYHQSPRLVASRMTAGQLGRRRLDWGILREMDWVTGPRDTPLRQQINAIFMRSGMAPPEPATECHSPHLIGRIIAANDDAVSILPADVAEDLAPITGMAIVPYSFDWSLPPVAMFTRSGEMPHRLSQDFATALRDLCTPSAAPLRGDYDY